MENGVSFKMNGHVAGSFMNGPDNVKALSNSKMSLNSMRSNASSVSVNTLNGYATHNGREHYEDLEVFLAMEQTDRRFGFSVVGGIDEGFPPKIDGISDDSPAERFGLLLEDEILEVNRKNVQNITHAEIVMLIHRCKKSITLKVRRYLPPPYEYVVERAIDVPGAYSRRSNGYINRTNGEVSPKTRVDGMLKHRVQPKAEVPSRDSNIPLRFVNEAYERDEDDDIPSPRDQDIQQAKSVGLPQFVTILDKMKARLKTAKQQEDLLFLQQLLNSKRFKSVIKTHNRMTRIHLAKKGIEKHKPVATNSLFLLTEVRLMMEMSDPTSIALSNIINKPEFRGLLTAHDHIAMRESLDTFTEMEDDPSEPADSDVLDELEEQGDENVTIATIDKTNGPLGATVRNEGDKVIVSRIVKGGAAEISGLLHEGDEILEINDNSVRGKDVNEVVEILSELEGTLTFVLIPGQNAHKDTLRNEGITVMKALFDYEPKNDEYIPCEELGLVFRKGDLLEILNQADPDWWQAQLMEPNHNKGGLAGLIPSKQFQLQRELSKITLIGEDQEPIIHEKKSCFCGRARRKGKKVPMKARNPPVPESQILTYEEMIRVFPDKRRKRPVVLIGPPQVGRREIRERLIMQYPERFAAAVPHTTRDKGENEINGVDYQFVSRSSFENSIATAEFIEHGVLSGDYYGTSFSAVESVIKSGKTCVLNMYCQALPVLKESPLRPYVVFVTVPRIGELKRLRELDDTCEPFNPHVRLKDSDLDELIEKARDMYRTHGHYFDKTLVNNDLDKTFDDLVQICNSLEQDPQWIYSSWVR